MCNLVNTFIQKGDQQYSDSKGLPSYVQQQPQTTSVATPQAVRSYPTPSTARQQNKLGIEAACNTCTCT